MIRHQRTVLVRCYIVSTSVIGISRTPTHRHTLRRNSSAPLRRYVTAPRVLPHLFLSFFSFLSSCTFSSFDCALDSTRLTFGLTFPSNTPCNGTQHWKTDLRPLCATMFCVKIMQISLKEKNSSRFCFVHNEIFKFHQWKKEITGEYSVVKSFAPFRSARLFPNRILQSLQWYLAKRPSNEVKS